MTREQLIDAVRKNAVNNSLSCELAQELAREMNVPPKEIGEIANELGVKLMNCRLGCF